MPLISVVVPIYKTERYLRQCVDSIISQTFKDYEIILVDDGSPDNCPKICDEYSEFENVNVVHKTNGGLVSARKAGVKASNGKYIMFVDSDDFITSGYLASFADTALKTNADIIVGGFTTYNEGATKEYFSTIPQGYYNKQDLQNNVYGCMLSTQPFYTFGVSPNLFTKCILKELVNKNYKNVSNEIKMGEDVALSYPCLLDAESMAIIPEVGYMYRYNNESITHTYNPKMAEQIIILLEHLFDTLKDEIFEKQIYSYSYMLESLLIKNEVYYSNNNGLNKYSNLKKWRENTLVKKIYKSEYVPKMPFMSCFESFSLKHNCLWLLSLIKCLRKIKWKILKIK